MGPNCVLNCQQVVPVQCVQLACQTPLIGSHDLIVQHFLAIADCEATALRHCVMHNEYRLSAALACRKNAHTSPVEDKLG